MAFSKVPSTLTPFLYQTRTIQQLLARHTGPTIASSLRALHASPCAHREHIPFELPPDLESQNPDARADEAPRRSTITPAEQKTFERIFQEIAARSATRPAGAKARPRQPGGAAGPPGAPAPSNNNPINVIIQEAAAAQSGEQPPSPLAFEPLGSPEGTYSAEDREQAFMRFPPSLRRAARMALGAAEQDAGGAAGAAAAELRARMPVEPEGSALLDERAMDSLARTIELENLRRGERVRVEDRMQRAKSDFALWEVLEEEVFPMVERLGIASGKPPKRPARRRRKAKEQQQQDPAAAAAPADELSLEVHGPLYPAYLLAALRLLDTGFAAPSPLALSVLPRVKQLGLASYVLGAGTPFYNALMGIYWHRYGDAPAVVGLLEEMRQAGLFFDEGTLQVVSSMEASYSRWSKGHAGGFLRRVMRMPEHEGLAQEELGQWRRRIQTTVRQRPPRVAM